MKSVPGGVVGYQQVPGGVGGGASAGVIGAEGPYGVAPPDIDPKRNPYGAGAISVFLEILLSALFWFAFFFRF